MALENDKIFGVRALSEAINLLPAAPSQIRNLGIFTPRYLSTTYAEVEYRDNKLNLVESRPRGNPGEPLRHGARAVHTFKIPHLPVDDVVRADDVQNLRAFGSTDRAEAVTQLVNDKLADGRAALEYTREHLMLGALMGKILDADGTELFDLHKEFNITPTVYNFALATKTTEVGKEIDKMKTAQAKAAGGEPFNGWAALCSPEFLQELVYHPTIKELYVRFQDGRLYREGDTETAFIHRGIRFIQYNHTFGEGSTAIPAGEAILLPLGTRQVFREFFAPADMNETVNTRAREFYASREKLPHDKGWSLHMQSNPLPMVLQPQLIARLKAA